MKKIGNFFKEHRIFTMLMAIVIVCFVLIMTVLINVFGGFNGDDGYRLEGRDQVEITEKKQSDIKNNITNNEKIKSVSISISDKSNRIHITMIVESGVLLEEAKGIALKSLDEFTEEEKAFYDFIFTLKQEATDKDPGYTIEGAKNASGTQLKWNNNTPVEKEETSE